MNIKTKKAIHNISGWVCMLSAGPTAAVLLICVDPIPVVVSASITVCSAWINVLTKV
jgi:hypothetical protein